MSKYNVGDIVTTTETLSYWGTPIPAGLKRVCALFESRGEIGIEDIPKTPNRNYVLKVDQVQPYAPTFKHGDVIEVLVDCDDPFFHAQLRAGDNGTVHGIGQVTQPGVVLVTTTDGTHCGYFSAKPQHLRLVRAPTAKPVIKAGDWVTTDQTLSHYGSKVPPGPLYVHQVHPAESGYLPEPERAHVGSSPTETANDVVIATRFLTPIVVHSVSLARPEKDEPKTKAGTGWTFRIPADTQIDGKRVLKELADAGADYAVVSWGKRDAQRLCLVSQRLAERAQKLDVARGTNIINPEFIVPDFGRGHIEIGLAKDGKPGYCFAGNTTLAELADYATRVKAAEQAKRPTTVRVNFGVAK